MFNFNIKRRLLLTILMMASHSAFSSNSHFDAGFQQGIQSAASLQSKAFNALRQYKPQEVINNYSDHPKEINYKNNPDAVKKDAVLAKQNDPTASSIASGIDERQKKFNYSKDPNSQEIKNIKKHADSIYDVITGQFGDCTKKTNCTTTYQTQSCEEAPASTLNYCKKVLNIDIIPHKQDTHYTLTAHLSVKDHNYAGVVVNVINGKIGFLGPHDASF